MPEALTGLKAILRRLTSFNPTGSADVGGPHLRGVVMSYDNTNSGAVFKNEKKTTEKQPDRTGSCEIACPGCGQVTEMWVSGWIKKSRAGQQYMSLAFTAKEEQNTSPKPEDDFDDDIPF